VLLVGVVAACGKSPAQPSAMGPLDTATMNGVTATVSEVVGLAAVATSSNTTHTLVTACPNGGEILTIVSAVPFPKTDTMTSRTEFNGCRTANATLRGDPYLTTAADFTSSQLSSTLYFVTITIQVTGALLIETDRGVARASYSCTAVKGPSTTSTGAITWEFPIGTPVRSTPCGPIG